MGIRIGMRVKYRREFLRSIGAFTGPMGMARGTVVGVKALGGQALAEVQWDKWGREVPGKVNVCNLTAAGDPERV